jgi:hypothetical protein
MSSVSFRSPVFWNPPHSFKQSVKELESLIQAWQQIDHRKHIPSTKLKSEKEKEKAKDAPKEGMFGIFKKSMYAYSCFIFASYAIQPIKGHSSGNTTAEVGVPADEKSLQPNVPTPGNPYDHVQSAIAALKSQHAALRGLFSLVDNSLPIVHESPLPASVVEQPEGVHTPVQFGGPIARKAWTSTTTSLSDGASVWFDAADEVDGAEEFFLDTTPLKASPSDGQIPDFGGQNNSRSFHDESDTDEEQEAARLSLAVSERGVAASARQVTHRMSLPSGPVADEGSLFAVFKNNVGKVLTHYGFVIYLCADVSMDRILPAWHSL